MVAALQNMAAEAGQEVREIIAKAQERHQELRSGAVQPVPLEEVEASAITGTLARFVAPEEAAARAAEYAEQRSRGVEMASSITTTRSYGTAETANSGLSMRPLRTFSTG